VILIRCLKLKEGRTSAPPIEKITVEVGGSEPWFLDLVDSVWNLGLFFLLPRIRWGSKVWVQVDPSPWEF